MSEREKGLVVRALEFAAVAHRDQRRKDNRTPAVVHLLRVKEYLRETLGVTDPKVLAAALLHDTVEDTDTTLAELAEAFGRDVAAYVELLSHDPGLPYWERTPVILDQVGRSPPEVLLVKVADRLDNILDMPGWRAKSRLGYLWETERIAQAVAERAMNYPAHPLGEPLSRALHDLGAAIRHERARAEHDLQTAEAQGVSGGRRGRGGGARRPR